MSHRYRHLALGWLVLAAVAAAGTRPARAASGVDLSARVVVDGLVDDYDADEWVLADALDSRWGDDNDIRRVALTWDHAYLYVAVECTTVDSRLLLFLDHKVGGVTDMRPLATLRRAVVLTGLAPDFLVLAEPQSEVPDAWRIDGDGAPELLGDGAIAARFVQAAAGPGVLELAIPWDLVRPSSGAVSLLAAVTGDDGTGCGDAAPDPSATLSTVATDLSVLDRALRVVVDDDGDGVPDDGVAPRDVAAVVPDDAPAVADSPALDVRPSVRSFAPDLGESVAFSLHREGNVGVARVYVTARVCSISGDVVRVLYQDDARDVSAADPPAVPIDSWDGTDRAGSVVPGGIYVLNVTWGVARGSRTGSASVSVAVVR